MENTKKKCEDYKPCNIKDKDGYCMNNDRSCIWREGAVDASERQLTIPDVVGRSEQLPCPECGGNGGGVTDNGWEQCDCKK